MRITYRNYKGQDPLAEFNPGVYDPLIKKYSPRWYDESKGRGILDPHGFLKAHPEYMASDGVHLTSKGYRAFRNKILLETMLEPVYGKQKEQVPAGSPPPNLGSIDDLIFQSKPTSKVDDSVAPVEAAKTQIPGSASAPKLDSNEAVQKNLLDAFSTKDRIQKGIHLALAGGHFEKLFRSGKLTREYRDEIRAYQRALKAYGADGVKITGAYDSITRKYVHSLRVSLAQFYLKKRGIYSSKINGVLDKNTKKALAQYAQNRFLDPKDPELLHRIIKRLAREHNP